MPGYLRQNTAVTITIGQFVDWADSKTPLYLALGGNANFDPTKLICTLTKGSSQSVLTLTKTGGINNVNLLIDSQISFELAANDTDTPGRLVLSFNNSVEGQEVILEGKTFEFMVIPAAVYDSLIGGNQLPVDVSFIRSVLEGDAEVDVSKNPWELVIKNKTTGIELIRKSLKDVNGTGITSTTKIIGQQKEPG